MYFLWKKLDGFPACQCDPLMEGMPGWAPPHRCASSFCFEWILPTEKGRRKSELQKGKAFKGLAWIFCFSNVYFVTWPFKTLKMGPGFPCSKSPNFQGGVYFQVRTASFREGQFLRFDFPEGSDFPGEKIFEDPTPGRFKPFSGRGQMIP